MMKLKLESFGVAFAVFASAADLMMWTVTALDGSSDPSAAASQTVPTEWVVPVPGRVGMIQEGARSESALEATAAMRPTDWMDFAQRLERELRRAERTARILPHH
jgi:hypothetical protein